MKSTEWDRIAKHYDKEIMNPLDAKVINPLKLEIKKIKNKKNKSALEIGCGLGRLAPTLSKSFKNVLCTDFSKEMINFAKKNNNNLTNVEFKIQNMLNLNEYHKKFDTVIAINSIILKNIIDTETALEQAKKCLKTNGTFIAIFPSLDSDIYRAALTFDQQYKKTKNENQAAKNTHKILDSECYDFVLGYFNNNGKQKHFFKVELEYRLKKAGFKNIEFQKTLYPWSMAEDSFPKEEWLWDWFVKAKV